jgi:hypothetical protein
MTSYMEMTMRARLRSLTPPRPTRHRSSPAREQPPPPAHQHERVGQDTFEWRMRESDGPVDLGYYACACGYEFAARVATTVRCPHCGAEQAW